MKTNFYFSEETIEYFKEIPPSKLKQEIWEFVVNNCQPEGNETYPEIADSLLDQVF